MRQAIRSAALLAPLALAATALAAPAPASAEGWYEDFDTAAAAAKEQGKDLLVDFTGSDWCGWCIRLDKEVFAHDEFLAAARDDYVLVKLDFPRGKDAREAVPNPGRNQELSERYEIRGFPTILLMTPEGDVFGQTGYQPGGPKKYLAHLADLREKGMASLNRAKELTERFAAATGAEKDALLEQVVAALENAEAGQPGARHLADAAKHALSADADDARGLKSRAVAALLEAGNTDPEVIDAARSLDPRNGRGLLEQAVHAKMTTVRTREDVEDVLEMIGTLDQSGGVRDERVGFIIYANAARWHAELFENPERGSHFAAKALAIGSDDAKLMKRLRELADA